jgi:hypothetical protein
MKRKDPFGNGVQRPLRPADSERHGDNSGAAMWHEERPTNCSQAIDYSYYSLDASIGINPPRQFQFVGFSHPSPIRRQVLTARRFRSILAALNFFLCFTCGTQISFRNKSLQLSGNPQKAGGMRQARRRPSRSAAGSRWIVDGEGVGRGIGLRTGPIEMGEWLGRRRPRQGRNGSDRRGEGARVTGMEGCLFRCEFGANSGIAVSRKASEAFVESSSGGRKVVPPLPSMCSTRPT